MSIPILSLNSLVNNLTQLTSQVKADHASIALAGQMGQQAVKKSKTDTVTISKKAIQMVSTTNHSSAGGDVPEKAVDQAQEKK